MIERLKRNLYFPLAWYFRFFASIKLRRWNPQVIVVTGSNGKTTLLHLLEAQIGERAQFSHHANSSYGIPFDILGLHRKSLLFIEWFALFLKAPFLAFTKVPRESIYVVEADCDRPGEGEFLAELLHPSFVLWTSVSRTHSQNFDSLVKAEKFKTVESAIAYEYGYFAEQATDLVVINGDDLLQLNEIKRASSGIKVIKQSDYLNDYELDKEGTLFQIKKHKYIFQALLPKEIFYAIAMTKVTMEHLELPFDASFANFVLPPGRGSVFAGIKGTTLIDSSYNGNLASIKTMLTMFKQLKGQKKWVVVGDMLELGEEEKDEHEKLAEILLKGDFERIILIGKRTAAYTYPLLQKAKSDKLMVESHITQREAKESLLSTIQGEEIILFKGSQSLLLEGLIEALLADKKDIAKLPRRERYWQSRRKSLGL